MSDINEKIDQVFDLTQQIHDYFGYVEDWVLIPLDDNREMFWTYYPNGRGGGSVDYALTKEALLDKDAGDYYSFDVYTQRFLPKWVYRGDALTMICGDPHVDGNHFLYIFNNLNEVKHDESDNLSS